MHTKEVTFPNNEGEQLTGTLHLPKKTTNKAVIVCHGFASTKDDLWIPRLCNALAHQGYAALRFDFSGNGASEGRFSDADCEKEKQDLTAALHFLKTKNYKTFATIGHSMGGTVVLMHADKNVKAIVAIAPAIHTKKVENRILTPLQKKHLHTKGHVDIMIKDKRHTLRKNFFTAFEQQNVLKDIKKVTAPILLIHGTDDHTIPLEESKAAARASMHTKLTVIEGGTHTLMKGTSANKLIKTITTWLTQNF